MPSRNVPDRHHSEAAYRAPDEFSGRLISRHIRIGNRRTNIRLTCLTWHLLWEIAERKRITVHEAVHRDQFPEARRNAPQRRGSCGRATLLPRRVNQPQRVVIAALTA
jgi:hypothetical protein